MRCNPPTSMGGNARDFPVTSWSAVLGAARGAGAAREHLEELCRAYWKPVYAYLRRRFAKSNDEAKDLTQSFFAWFLEKGVLERVISGRGRFRNFLKVTLKNFLRDHERARRAVARGGRVRLLSLDGPDAPPLPAPGRSFEETWAATTVERATRELELQYEAARNRRYFDVFRERELRDPPATYRELAERFGTTEGEVEKILKHARAAMREIVRTAVLLTVDDPSELEDELRALGLAD